MSYSAGLLNQRVTLQQRAPGQNVLGEATGAWADVATVWARVQPLRGRELFAAGQVQAGVELRITLRYLPGVVSSMRVLWEGRPYAILGEPIDVEGGHHTLELMCQAWTGRAA